MTMAAAGSTHFAETTAQMCRSDSVLSQDPTFGIAISGMIEQ